MRQLATELASANEASRPRIASQLETGLLEFDDDGSWDAMACWRWSVDVIRNLDAGWPLGIDELSLAVEVRARLAQSTGACSYLEAWLTRQVLLARRSGGLEIELSRLMETQNLGRYVVVGSGDQTWCLLLAAMIQRIDGRIDLALACLEDAGRTVDLQWRAGRLEKLYLALELSSCFQGLGRPTDAARELVEIQTAIGAWEPGSEREKATRASYLSTVGLALARQYCNVGRGRRALGEIGTARLLTKSPEVLAQLHYYEAVAFRILGGGLEERAACLERALGSGNLDSVMQVMAGLEQASLRIETGELSGASESLALVESGVEGGASPTLQAHVRAIASRLARTEGLTEEGGALHLARVRQAYSRFLEGWRATDDGLGVGILTIPERRYLVGELIELTLLVTPGQAGVEAALEDIFMLRASGALARSLNARTPTLTDVRQRLLREERDGLLVFVPGVDHVHMFAVDRKRAIHVSLPGLIELESSTTRLWRELGRAPVGTLGAGRSRYEALARELGATIFPPEVARLLQDWERVQVVGASLLNRIPLETLEVDGVGYLGLKRQVVNIPSVAVGVALADEAYRGVTDGSLLALVTPSSAPGAAALDTLEFREASQLKIQAAWGLERVIWKRAERATVGALVDSKDLSALLIFSHGERDPARPRPLCVRLAPSDALPTGRFFPDDVEGLASGAIPPIVVLATCGGGGGALKIGSDDGDHLGAAFLRRGAHLVLMSSAPLEQTATAILCEEFLAELSNGTSPAEAIRRAREELKSNPLFDHPYYWGTFVAFGWDGA